MSPPSSSIAVKHGPCLLNEKQDPGFRNQVHEETSPHHLPGAQDKRLDAEQNQLPCGSTGTSSGNRQGTETCVVRHVTRHDSLQNRASGHLGEWATPWSVEEMLNGQHQRVEIPPILELLTRAFCRKDWKRISAESSLMSLRRPSRSR